MSVRATDLPGLRSSVARGKLEPVYLIVGEESLLADEAVALLIEASIDAPTRDFNCNLYSGDDEGAREFLSQARSFPFMAKRRVVVVRRFEKLSLREPRAESAFLEYLAAPAPTTVLVLAAGKLDRRLKLSQAIERVAHVVKVDGLREAELPAWVKARFAAAGVRVAAHACQRMVEIVGPNLLDLRNEIDKVVARFSDEIGEQEIVDTVGAYRQEVVWAISRGFRPDNMHGFLGTLSRVLETENEPIGIAAVISRHVRQLLKLKFLLDKGVRGSELARRAGAPWVDDALLSQARAFSKKQLVLWLHNLQRADFQMKRLRLPQRWILERALVNSFLGEAMRHPARMERGRAA